MVQRSLFPVLTGTILLVGIGWNLHASARQTPAKNPAPPNQTKPASPKPQKFAVLDSKDTNWDSKTGMVIGHDFTYREEEMTITGVLARYNEKTKRLLAEGDLTMDDPQYHITGDKADVDNSRAKKLAIITGNVKILIKPKEKDANAKPEEKEDAGAVRRRGGTVTCDRVESYFKKKLSTLSGSLVFKQTITKNGRDILRTVTADHADYDGNAEKMTLYPPVKGNDSDGQTFEAEDIVLIGTKEGEETLESKGKIKITLIPEEEEEEDGKTPPPAANSGKK